MTFEQQGDVLHFQTVDGGEINSVNGVVEMGSGLATAAYLSLFGGNEDDDGSDGSSENWWGNLDETEVSKQYRSRTQFLLKSLPATSANLRSVEDAANFDLARMTDTGAAETIEVVASIPGLNKLKIIITINGNETLEFVENWKAAA